MQKNKKEKTLTSDEITNLLSTKRNLNSLLEQNRVIGIKENENDLLNKLQKIKTILGQENLNELETNIPFGGFEIDSSDLKNKSTEELMRIQTVQINTLLKKYLETFDDNQKFNQKLLETTIKIHANLQFWFYLFIISTILYVIVLFLKSS